MLINVKIEDYLVVPEEQIKTIRGVKFSVEELKINDRLLIHINVVRIEHFISWYWVNPKDGKMYAGCLANPTLFNLSDPQDIQKTVEGGLAFMRDNAKTVIAAILEKQDQVTVEASLI